MWAVLAKLVEIRIDSIIHSFFGSKYLWSHFFNGWKICIDWFLVDSYWFLINSLARIVITCGFLKKVVIYDYAWGVVTFAWDVQKMIDTFQNEHILVCLAKWCWNWSLRMIQKRFASVLGGTRFLISNTFISNTTLKITKF